MKVWLYKIAIEPRYLVCWVPVLQQAVPDLRSDNQLPCFMLQQLMSAFSCLYAETLDCAQHLKCKVCGSKRLLFFFIYSYISIYKCFLVHKEGPPLIFLFMQSCFQSHSSVSQFLQIVRILPGILHMHPNPQNSFVFSPSWITISRF